MRILKWLTTYCLFYLQILCGASALASTPDLTLRDIRPMVEEMLAFHVEYKEMSPLLIKRAFKNFIDQFDPQKIYLTALEVRPYIEMAEKRYQEVVFAYLRDEYPDFASLHRLIVKAVRRHVQWRQEAQRELILSGQVLTAEAGESYLGFVSNEAKLKERMRRQLVRFLWEERQQQLHRPWNPAMREKICNLWDRRLSRNEKNYLVGKVHCQALHILKSIARSLDAHTSFFSMEEALEMRASLEKQFEGVGVILRESIDGVVIAGLVPGGPAERSEKVAAGDLVVQINGRSQIDATYDEVLNAMQGAGNGMVRLGLRRFGKDGQEQLIEVQLKKEKILLQKERLQCTAQAYEDGVIGKLVLPSFYESADGSGCDKDIKEAIRSLKKQGTLKGLVLDLRENSGGFLSQAVKVAGLFMTSGVVVISKYSQGQVQYLRNLDGRIYYDGPLVVLTSRLSASAAEIVAQALQDYGTAIIVGDERTYGKGTIQYQTITDAGARAFFKVTVGRYYTVSGKSTQIDGVRADIVVPSAFSVFRIGERFLEYPLSSDRMPAAYMDPLSDLDAQRRVWFQKNYLPNLQQKQSQWQKLIPELKEGSRSRLAENPVCQDFLQRLRDFEEGNPSFLQRDWWGGGDWQMVEATDILQHMIELSRSTQLIPAPAG